MHSTRARCLLECEVVEVEEKPNLDVASPMASQAISVHNAIKPS